MAQPSDLENRAVFALPNGFGFSADYVLQAAGDFPFQGLSIVVAGLYQSLE
ncbi:hypothetical protein [Pararhodobacter sp.]|uniref:hypothetical protein n=1 Tax=Pararhodobacter sp. TaxID=2127056 RepID=UPI002AFFF97B|nr:hypothetical protein [Pararhodobacter sp.]